MTMAYEPTGEGPDQSVKEELTGFGRDLKSEVKSEVAEMKRTGDVVDPNHTDELVQKHVTGLSISLFVIIALVLLAAIGGIYWYSHANHQTDRPGLTVSLIGA
jgi:hypothetical protein